jgi:hypothetical protein
MTTEVHDDLTELEELIQIPLDHRDENNEAEIRAWVLALISRFREFTAAVSHEPGLVRILREIATERERQQNRFGLVVIPHGTGTGPDKLAAIQTKSACQNAMRQGTCTWKHVLREEVFEAFAESDPDTLRAELIQVAAVATAWVEAIDQEIGQAPPAMLARVQTQDGQWPQKVNAAGGCWHRVAPGLYNFEEGAQG